MRFNKKRKKKKAPTFLVVYLNDLFIISYPSQSLKRNVCELDTESFKSKDQTLHHYLNIKKKFQKYKQQ